MILAARSPAATEPAKCQFERPMTTGLMALSQRLLSRGNAPSSRKLLSITLRFSTYAIALPSAELSGHVSLLLLRPLPQFFQHWPGITLPPLPDFFDWPVPDLLFKPVQPGYLPDRHRRSRILVGFIKIGEVSAGMRPTSCQHDTGVLPGQSFIRRIPVNHQVSAPVFQVFRRILAAPPGLTVEADDSRVYWSS